MDLNEQKIIFLGAFVRTTAGSRSLATMPSRDGSVAATKRIFVLRRENSISAKLGDDAYSGSMSFMVAVRGRMCDLGHLIPPSTWGCKARHKSHISSSEHGRIVHYKGPGT